MKQIPGGVWPTMITPFTEENRIDEKALEKQIDWYIEKGCKGLFAVCQSSEMYFLSLEERVRLAELTVKFARGRVPVIAAGATGESLEEQKKEIEAIWETGIDAFVLLVCRLAGRDDSDEIWIRNAQEMLDAFPDVSFGLYECPSPYHRLLTEKTLSWAVKTGRFAFLKDTCCDADLIRQRLLLIEKETPSEENKLKLFNANTLTLLDTLRNGAAGFSGLMANTHPELYAWLIENFDKDVALADTVQSMITLLSEAEGPAYPVSAKRHMKDMGIPMTLMTRTIAPDSLKPKHIETLRQAERIEKMFYEWLLKQNV